LGLMNLSIGEFAGHQRAERGARASLALIIMLSEVVNSSIRCV
jgi:hypothetical protein